MDFTLLSLMFNYERNLKNFEKLMLYTYTYKKSHINNKQYSLQVPNSHIS